MAVRRAPAKEQGPWDIIATKLQVHTEDQRKPQEQRTGATIGVKTGLNITHAFNELFMLNYDLQLDDERLAELMQEEFPHKRFTQTIAAYRGYFNGGKHGFGGPSAGGKPSALTGEYRLQRFVSAEEEAKEAADRQEKQNAAKAAKEAAAPPAAAPKGGAPVGGGRRPAPAAPAAATPAKPTRPATAKAPAAPAAPQRPQATRPTATPAGKKPGK